MAIGLEAVSVGVAAFAGRCYGRGVGEALLSSFLDSGVRHHSRTSVGVVCVAGLRSVRVDSRGFLRLRQVGASCAPLRQVEDTADRL
jgi:hypothetical protein